MIKGNMVCDSHEDYTIRRFIFDGAYDKIDWVIRKSSPDYTATAYGDVLYKILSILFDKWLRKRGDNFRTSFRAYCHPSDQFDPKVGDRICQYRKDIYILQQQLKFMNFVYLKMPFKISGLADYLEHVEDVIVTEEQLLRLFLYEIDYGLMAGGKSKYYLIHLYSYMHLIGGTSGYEHYDNCVSYEDFYRATIKFYGTECLLARHLRRMKNFERGF